MLRFLCCCCFSRDDHSDERQSVLHPPRPSEVNGAESARRTHRAHSGTHSTGRCGQLVMRRVCVPELDQRFSDMAETFNEQQKSYEAMVQHIRKLQQSCDCTRDDTLSFTECVRKFQEEHRSSHTVTLVIKGYDFSLSVLPVRTEDKKRGRRLPKHLQFAQNELKGTSESAKATISKGTTLKELIGWLLRSQDQMVEQVKGKAETYQEEGRLTNNLEENLQEIRRAKELSEEYRQQAGEVLTEAAQIAGAHM